MRIIWTLLKVVIGLAIAIPLAIFIFATTIGVLGAMIGLVAVVVATVILVFFGIGYALGRLFL